MPRGDNPNSRANLITPTSKQAREYGHNGGVASGETRRALKSFREIDEETTTPEERAEMWSKIKHLAKKGNLKAFEIYRDTVGEKPSEKVEVKGELNNPLHGLTEDELRRLASGTAESNSK